MELLLALQKNPKNKTPNNTHTFEAYLLWLFIMNDGCSGGSQSLKCLATGFAVTISLSFLRLWLPEFRQGAGSPSLVLASLFFLFSLPLSLFKSQSHQLSRRIASSTALGAG